MNRFANFFNNIFTILKILATRGMRRYAIWRTLNVQKCRRFGQHKHNKLFFTRGADDVPCGCGRLLM